MNDQEQIRTLTAQRDIEARNAMTLIGQNSALFKKVGDLEAELVEVRSQLDKVRAALEKADSAYADDVAEGYRSPEAVLSQLMDELWSALGFEPVSPEELAKISPRLANILKEGRVS